MVDAAQIAGLNCLRLMNETTAGPYQVFWGRAWQVSAGFCLLPPRLTLIIKMHTLISMSLFTLLIGKHFSLQLHWRMESTNRISLLPRRKPGMLCSWTLAILDTKHQCVPLIRANSRCVENKSTYSTFSFSNLREASHHSFNSFLASSSCLSDTFHSL